MPLYRCRGKDCKFSTDSLEDYVDHVAEEKIRGMTTPLPREELEEEPIRRHRTAEELVNCPECRPKLEQEFRKLGWAPTEVKKEAGEKKETEIV